MKALTVFLLVTYGAISVLWVRNSAFLFSKAGGVIWFISICAGFFLHRMSGTSSVKSRRVLLVSNYFMVFLAVLTMVIYFTVSSMP